MGSSLIRNHPIQTFWQKNALHAAVSSVMCAYNTANGQHLELLVEGHLGQKMVHPRPVDRVPGD